MEHSAIVTNQWRGSCQDQAYLNYPGGTWGFRMTFHESQECAAEVAVS